MAPAGAVRADELYGALEQERTHRNGGGVGAWLRRARARVLTSFVGSATPDQFGWIVFDWADSIYVIATSYVLPQYVTDLYEATGAANPKSFWAFASSAATVASLVAYLTFCSVGEYGYLKYGLSRSAALVGALCTGLSALALEPSLVWAVGALYVISRVCARVSGLMMDAALFEICDNDDALTHNVSAKAAAVGYLGMLFFFLMIGPLLVADIDDGYAAMWAASRVPLLLIALWWSGFVLYAFRFIQPRPGRPLPASAHTTTGLLRFSFSRGVADQIASLRALRGLVDIDLFLVGWMFLSDASSTAQTVAVLIARDVLGLSTTDVGIALFIGLVTAVAGMTGFRALVRTGRVSPKAVLVINVASMTAIAAYVLVMSSALEVYALSAVAGLNIGSVSSFTRSMLASMIPKGRQTSIFAVYELTQKGTAWLGPLLVGALNEALGEQYYRQIVVGVVLAEVALGLPFFLLVQPERGRRVASELAVRAGGHMQVKAGAFGGAASDDGDGDAEHAQSANAPSARRVTNNPAFGTESAPRKSPA